MALNSHLLASGPGWSVSDIVCYAGPRDRLFEEQHGSVCIAAVTAGTFRYRTTVGGAVLAPGAVLLGNHGTCFECGHEHSTGDRCLSFHFTPEHVEAIVAAVPGARRTAFTVPRLPPLPSLVPLLAMAEAARDEAQSSGSWRCVFLPRSQRPWPVPPKSSADPPRATRGASPTLYGGSRPPRTRILRWRIWHAKQR